MGEDLEKIAQSIENQVTEKPTPEEIRTCTKDYEWQSFRKSLKGLPSKEKLQKLIEFKKSHTDRCHDVQVYNYIGALRRGGQLKENATEWETFEGDDVPPELERCVKKIIDAGRINPKTGKKYTEQEAWAICRASVEKLSIEDFDLEQWTDCSCGKHLHYSGDVVTLEGEEDTPCPENTFLTLELDEEGYWVIKE